MPCTTALPQTRQRYIAPDAKLVDLSFAGRLPNGHRSLAAIAVAKTGDSVQLSRVGNRWLIRNLAGQTLGRMSRAFSPPELWLKMGDGA